MRSRRLLSSLVVAGLALAATSGPALGKKPGAGDAGERPLTRQEQAASNRKAAEAERYVASVAASGGDLAALACFVPESTEAARVEGPLATTAVPVEEVARLSPLACAAAQGFLAVEARDQVFGHYCGPAVGQVIANYSWAMAAGRNAFTQQKIAGWMSTDINGQTGAFAMEFGLEKATAGSPRRPGDWDWLVTVLEDTDRDGWVGDQLDAMVRSNISNSRMPLAIPVKPHDPNSPSGAHLSSWPKPVASVGHWVSIYGWVGVHDGTDRARMYFTDSSRDEGGATGKFWTPTRWFALMILEHTRRLVW